MAKINIFIKSFNRPYYLERCVRSIYENIINTDYKIIILDDGTPQKYLNKITKDFPLVVIKKSELYTHKQESCLLGVEPDDKSIPINMWVDGIKESSDFFLLLEDDIWITKRIKLGYFVDLMKKNRGHLMKFYWLGNKNLIQNKKETVLDSTVLLEPNLFVKQPFLYKLIFYKFNKLKIRKTFKFLKIHTRKKDSAYYSIYSVASALYNKKYFLNLWENHSGVVEEKLQVFNALKYLKNNKNISFFRTTEEVMATGFCSAATNRKYKNIEFNMFHLNKVINEVWLNNDFNCMENFPKDFSEAYIEGILKKNNSSDFMINNWKKWRAYFISSFESFGCTNIG